MTTLVIGDNTGNTIGVVDASIVQNLPTSPQGTNTSSNLQAATVGQTNRKVYYFSGLPTGPVTVTSAILSLRNADVAASGRVVEMRKLLNPFVEGQVTWNNRITGTAWNVAGALGGADVDSTVIATGTLPTTAETYFNISGAGFNALVQGWMDGSITNNGIILSVIDDTTVFDGVNHRIRDKETVTNGQRPYLTVTYTPLTPPNITVDDIVVSTVSGTASFTVSLSSSYASTVSVNYATADQTATAGSDYQSASGVLTFAPGETSKQVTVAIINPTAESPETFNLNLSSPVNATIVDGQGVGTIYQIPTAAISADFTPARTSGVAPLSVFFDASATVAPVITGTPFHDLHYEWDFGDPAGGAVWSQGCFAAESKNTAVGPVTNHVFETAGTYTVSLVAKWRSINGVMRSHPVAKTITVSAADTVFAGNTICISTTGDFTGAPAGATTVTRSDYATAINAYQSTYKRILFHAGQTFNDSVIAGVNTAGPGHIGRFGSGANPIFNSTATSFFNMGLKTSPGNADWRLVDLDLDGLNTAVFGVGSDGTLNQVLLLRVTMRNVQTGSSLSEAGLNYWNGAGGFPGHTLWDQWAFVDSTISNINNGVAAGGLIGIYLSGSRFTLMGNNLDSNLGGEHVVRTPYLDRAVISNNTFKNSPPSKHLLTIRGADAAAPGTSLVKAPMETNKIYVGANRFYAVSTSWGCTVAPQNTFTDERLSDIIWERNFHTATGVVDFALISRGTVARLSIRNNIVDQSGSSSTSPGAFSLSGTSPYPSAHDHKVFNNTLYYGGTATVHFVTYGATLYNVTAANNLMYTPNTATANFYLNTIDSGLVHSNNSTDIQARLSNPLFSTTPSAPATLAASDYKITTGSYAINSGMFVPVHIDNARVSRTGTYDLGAIQP